MTNGHVRFEVRDTGIGIREGDQDRLLSAFEQLGRVKNKNMTGAKEDDLENKEEPFLAFQAPDAKVLLVDDIEIDLVATTYLLEEYGILPDPAASGIVALTANAVQGMIDLFLQNGFNDFLPKPVDRGQLSRCLLRWLPPALITLENGEDAAGESAG